MSIKITDQAFCRVSQWIKSKNEPDLILRISVEGGGCNGYTYKYELVPHSDITADDSIFDNGTAKIIIDNISMQFMQDSVLDYRETVGKSRLEIINPNVKGRCGCGNSFS